MDELKPSLYLDKGALGTVDLQRVSENFQIFYSEATLFDLLNDNSGARDLELDELNKAHALYLYREADQILAVHADAKELMRKIDPLELEIMGNCYRFLNGGGTLSLFDVMHHQLSVLLKLDDEIQDAGQLVLQSISSDQSLEPLKKLKAEKWRIELQKATNSWSQSQDATLRSVLNDNPELAQQLKEYFPDTLQSPEQIHLAAMLLGALQMGSDRGIVSPRNEKSEKAARNGYIDCLHIMFGLHCQIFLTTDKATLRRFHLLNDFWRLARLSALVSKQS